MLILLLTYRLQSLLLTLIITLMLIPTAANGTTAVFITIITIQYEAMNSDCSDLSLAYATKTTKSTVERY